MKKTFELEHEKIKYPRMIEAAKNKIRKYVKRERRKELPAGVDYWDFECRFGDTEAEAESVHLAELDERVNDAASRGIKSFFVEIVATEGVRGRSKPAKELPKLKTFGGEKED